MTERPNPEALGRVAAEHLGPILYALEVCAMEMVDAGREEDARYFRDLARLLSRAGGTPPSEADPEGRPT
ncbi:MAG: hypothetical protein GTN62_11330 [Gemmatimonadales bacterium]|nr:hypothetical protein [Gemmatimonadales bacterium]NIN50686.1 hypothetical protein [Gemmatimonadales bacterium]NIP08150.1 hypothetical protein [Gemmatimonadales bacterium]NIR01028.1 hypothetical protein [Gemmatimonadales bacterium]NIS65107.1 hypothetical protein [Gemmatimonadales bacterium]